MKKLTKREIEKRAVDFIKCKSIMDLGKLGLDANAIKLHALKPAYYTFSILKKNGKKRTIEAPKTELKIVQKTLNRYLQCVYYVFQTKASHGYIISSKREKNPKNILENAKSHLGAKHLLNIDFKDFFHQFSTSRIKKMISSPPFSFSDSASHLLSRLFTFKGRLPMGTPTSPVLSNFGTINFDNEMTEWALTNQISYTRFVDDLSFSSALEITSDHIKNIKTICKLNKMIINPSKVKYFGPEKTKKVTGLILRDTVDVEDSFYHELKRDLQRLKSLSEVNLIMNNRDKQELLAFKREVQGQINFIGMIEGYDSNLFHKYRRRLKSALNPDLSVLSARWNNLNYL